MRPTGSCFAESLSLGVAMRLSRRAIARSGEGRERGKLTAAQVQRVEELVQSKLGGEASLGMLAQATGFSLSQFVRVFKNTFGCTPYHYVFSARIERARELVISSSVPLAIIAAETGFASQSHMTSAFVRAYKSPPGEMRRGSRKSLPDAVV